MAGYVVWEGASPFDGGPIVAIVTMHSGNRKTGDMAQVWILRADMAPTAAVRSGQDAAICGACPLRGDGTGKARACYVVLAQAPTSVYRAYRRGSYPYATPASVGTELAGRTVRLGAYGDPTMVPLPVVKALLTHAKGHTGYTHAWRTCDQSWRQLLMASADSVTEQGAARAAGWRSFVVLPRDADIPAGMVECMATRDRDPLTCARCLACSGTRGRSTPAVDIAIRAHGAGARYVTAP